MNSCLSSPSARVLGTMMDEDPEPLLASKSPTERGRPAVPGVIVKPAGSEPLGKGFWRWSLFWFGTSMCGRQQGFLARHLEERPKVPHGPQGAFVPVWPDRPLTIPRPEAPSCSCDPWRTPPSEPAQPGKGLRCPAIGIQITAHGGPSSRRN